MHHLHTHHTHAHGHGPAHLPPALDPQVPDAALPPFALSRRRFLRAAGLLGAGAALASVSCAPAWRPGGARGAATGPFHWLAGDHHIHTQYSSDGIYRVVDHALHARAYGLDWMVITDHGAEAHARIGLERTYPDVVAARAAYDDLLIFQGFEWNIPAAEHGTVFVHPGRDELALLQEFERSFDGTVNGTNPASAAHEALAVAGIDFLGDAVRRHRIADALFLANHPARRGLDAPGELRAWRDADPHVAIGMEGAPGHQAMGIPAPHGRSGARGAYGKSPGPGAWTGFPDESYRTWGGFDWMTATVGGLWDSLLAEGKPWWITANSDVHFVHLEALARGPGGDYPRDGQHPDPVYTGAADASAGDFWPGFFSKTHVGAAQVSYAGVMQGLRAGRIWVDQGGLARGLQARVRRRGERGDTPLGGVARVPRGAPLELAIDIDLATAPNWAGFVPRLARVDVIRGAVTGPAGDLDAQRAPGTRVVASFEPGRPASGRVTWVHDLGRAEGPFYVRLRGTDGRRGAPGAMGADVDPHGPAMDVPGDADPWADLWLYGNPIFVMPQG